MRIPHPNSRSHSHFLCIIILARTLYKKFSNRVFPSFHFLFFFTLLFSPFLLLLLFVLHITPTQRHEMGNKSAFWLWAQMFWMAPMLPHCQQPNPKPPTPSPPQRTAHSPQPMPTLTDIRISVLLPNPQKTAHRCEIAFWASFLGLG